MKTTYQTLTLSLLTLNGVGIVTSIFYHKSTIMFLIYFTIFLFLLLIIKDAFPKKYNMNLLQDVMQINSLTEDEAIEQIQNMRERVDSGESAKEILYEFGLHSTHEDELVNFDPKNLLK
jgi:hypothetical protein